jgi:probable phosphoglycerate mutase
MTLSARDAQGDVTRVLAVRHGETDWNVENRIQGQLDVPLNALGRWQAQRLALAMSGEAIDAIYTSDLRRTVETAVPTARGRGIEYVTERGLRERGFGVFEGLTFTEIEQRWPEQSARWRRREPEFGAEGGETLNEFYARSVAMTTRLATAHPGQTILIVTHGGVLDCLYRAASRVALDAPRSWQIGNAGINRLLYTPQGFTLIGWSDDHHLEDAPLDEAADGDTALRARRA